MAYTHPVTNNANGLSDSLSPPDASYDSPPPPHRFSLYGNIVPLPSQVESAVSLHPALAHADRPVLIYNLIDHPRNGDFNRHHPILLRDWPENTATFPELSDITIRVPNVDRPVVVHAEFGGAVMIIDVLTTLHRELRAEAVRRIHGAQTRSSVLLEDPRNTHPEPSEVAIRSAVTQILGGRIFWDGLTPSDQERDVWTLHVR